MTKAITDNEFESEVLKSDKPVLVDFWAEWCGPCRMLGPVIDEIAGEKSDKLKVVKMNIDENPNTPSELGVRGIPALMLFKDGKQIGSEVGNKPKNTITDWIDSLI